MTKYWRSIFDITKIFLALLLGGSSMLLYSQTSTTSDGNWNTGANWSSGVPSNSATATVTNEMTIDGDIEVDGGSYTVSSGTALDPSGGSDYKLTVKGSGYLEVDGNMTFGNNLTLENDGEILIKGCDTLRIGGDVFLKDQSILTIEACGVLYVEGNLEINNENESTVDGNIYVEGNATVQNEAVLSGTGNIEAEGIIDIKDDGEVFGNVSGCTPGPCEYGSGQGLPIELIYFDAYAISSAKIQARWSTASEINNDYFTLEYSFNGRDFFEGKRITAAGNSQIEMSYEEHFFVSNSPMVYVRLKQTDFDGQFEVFNPVAVKMNGVNHQYRLSDNLGNGKNLLLTINSSKSASNYNISIFNSVGKLIYKSSFQSEESSHYNYPIPDLSQNSKGIYFIRLESIEGTEVKRYILQ